MRILLIVLFIFTILPGIAIGGHTGGSELECEKCHGDKIVTRSSHFIESEKDCVFCHQTLQSLTSMGQHEIVTFSDDDACQSCHTSGGIPVSTIGHESLRCVDCHNPHGSAYENNLNNSVITLCSESCHTTHELGRSHPIGAGVVDPNTRADMT